MSIPFQLLPALDISGSFAVRPSQGVLDSNSFTIHPEEVLADYIQAGATWVHIVDLDQAFSRGNNQDLIRSLIDTAPEINFQISGGIRDKETFSRALDSGAKRINLACQSLANDDWLRKTVADNQDFVSFALDIRGALVAPRGSDTDFGSFEYVVENLEDMGVKVLCLTDVIRDGMLSGPNLELIERVSTLTKATLISSGGVGGLNDLQVLIDSPYCSGAIIGKAIQVGDLDLVQALEKASGR